MRLFALVKFYHKKKKSKITPDNLIPYTTTMVALLWVNYVYQSAQKDSGYITDIPGFLMSFTWLFTSTSTHIWGEYSPI